MRALIRYTRQADSVAIWFRGATSEDEQVELRDQVVAYFSADDPEDFAHLGVGNVSEQLASSSDELEELLGPGIVAQLRRAVDVEGGPLDWDTVDLPPEDIIALPSQDWEDELEPVQGQVRIARLIARIEAGKPPIVLRLSPEEPTGDAPTGDVTVVDGTREDVPERELARAGRAGGELLERFNWTYMDNSFTLDINRTEAGLLEGVARFGSANAKRPAKIELWLTPAAADAIEVHDRQGDDREAYDECESRLTYWTHLDGAGTFTYLLGELKPSASAPREIVQDLRMEIY